MIGEKTSPVNRQNAQNYVRMPALRLIRENTYRHFLYVIDQLREALKGYE